MSNTPPRENDRPGSRALPVLWWALFAMLAILLVVLALVLALRTPETVERVIDLPVPADEQAALADLAAGNRRLESSIAELDAVLTEGQCDAIAETDELDIDALLGIAPGDEAPPADDPPPTAADATPEPEPETSKAPDEESARESDTADGDELQPLARRALRERVERATVLVLAPVGGGKMSTGSGFFVSPNLVVTNRHVVEKASSPKVMLTSQSLGRVVEARVVSLSASSKVSAPDFAVISVTEISSPVSLPLSASFETLSPVLAVGYPGLTIANDSRFNDLLRGDVNAAPAVVINRGDIQTVQPSANGGELIAHSSNILKGNSGGPLVDTCGRVVGVNTFISVSKEQAANISYALSARMLKKFLTRLGHAFSDDDARCAER